MALWIRAICTDRLLSPLPSGVRVRNCCCVNVRKNMEEMSSCDYTDYDSPEDNEEDESDPSGDFSSADDPVDSPHQRLVQYDTSVLHSVHSERVAPSPFPLTSRVVFHPSFEAYYAAVAVQQNLVTLEMQLRREEGFTANPGEYFYTDPLLAPGHRVYNCVSPASHNVFGCFRLQTPPPIMSSCVFPSAYEDDLCGEGEVLGEPINKGEVVAGPLLQSEDRVVPQCLPSPVWGSPAAPPPACGSPAATPPAWGSPAAPPPAWGSPAVPPPAWGSPAVPPPAWGSPAAPPPAWGSPAAPSPLLYSASELQAACGLLWLSSLTPVHITS